MKIMKSIILYYSPNDQFSADLRYFLKSLQLDFEEHDVTLDEKASEEAEKKSGQLGLPVLEIDSEIIVGFDKERVLGVLKSQKLI